MRAGNRARLGTLVRRHEQSLFALLVRLTGGDAHRADDLFQETFLRAVRSAQTFDASKRFRPWLTAIAVNLVRDDARKRKLRGEVALETEDGEHLHGVAVDPGESPAEQAQRGDEASQVKASLKRLTEKEREVVLLHFYNGMTLVEVAAALEVPVGTVKSRLHGALTRLKGLLDGLLG
ncbi:MAG: RNA polymerase sigma factor [Planctomycetota bacterium]|nr:RNA polymerase sigma factor [Planctomycetota bacterium]